MQVDFRIMCENAMIYNKPETIYHKAARKLLHSGMKILSQVSWPWTVIFFDLFYLGVIWVHQVFKKLKIKELYFKTVYMITENFCLKAPKNILFQIISKNFLCI